MGDISDLLLIKLLPKSNYFSYDHPLETIRLTVHKKTLSRNVLEYLTVASIHSVK